MLVHHSPEDYGAASTKAAVHARASMEAMIAKGRAQGQRVIHTLSDQVITDYSMPTVKMRFAFGEDNGAFKIKGKEKELAVTNFARGQILTDAKVPQEYFGRLTASGDWGKNLAAHTLNEVFSHKPVGEKMMLRTVSDELRGYVTESYQPRDTAMLVEAFLDACKPFDAQPYEARVSDSRFHIRMILPMVFEPVKNEPCAMVLEFRESEFGNGATVLRASLLRLGCTNLAIFDNALREVHLGGSKNPAFKWQKDTIRAMTMAMGKQMRDVVHGQFSPERVKEIMALVKRADEEKIEPFKIAAFLKANCDKAEAKLITEAFTSADVDMMPAGQTVYRFSNAISFFAQDEKVSADRREELQELAGKAMKLAA
jgi:hypothetical protein